MSESPRLRTLAAVLCAALLAPSGRADSPAYAVVHPFEVIRANDIRVGRTFFRLATANADACPASRPMTGLLGHYLLDYPSRSRVNLAGLFERSDAPAAYEVIGGSPAAAAGLRAGDSLIAIGGRSLIEVAAAAAANKQLAGVAVDEAIADALRSGPAELNYVRDGRAATTTLASVPGCAFRFVMLRSGRPNSYAGKDTIAVTAGLLKLARTDAQLAAVLGHEMAHLIFDARWTRAHERHRKGPAVELAADRAGMIMMARAGYDPVEARIFWDDFPHDALAALLSGEHPPSGVRKAAVEKNIADIAAAHGERIPF